MVKRRAALLFICAMHLGDPADAQSQSGASVVEVNSANVRRALGQAVEAGDRQAITINVWLLARMGASLSPPGRARVAPFMDLSGATALPGELDALFDANALPTEASNLVATVPTDFRLIEGVAFDPARRRLFAGSVIHRRLLVQERGGWTPLPIDNLGGVFGMAVDRERGLLWLTTGPAEVVPDGQAAFAGLVAIHLDRLTEVRRISMPGARPGDVALAGDGTLFVSDGQSGTISVCRPGCTAPQVLLAPGRLRSPQGMAVWPDGRHLIVADYSQGLLRIEIATGGAESILPAQPAMLEGIDGLLLHRGRLVAIQNGGAPRRILAISLDREARAITAIEVLERAHSSWGEPTLGTIDGETLIYVADAQWERSARAERCRAKVRFALQRSVHCRSRAPARAGAERFARLIAS